MFFKIHDGVKRVKKLRENIYVFFWEKILVFENMETWRGAAK